MPFDISLPLLSVTGSIGIVAAALALGIRHGIDWDHIAAITDITSTAASAPGSEERWLVGEPGVMLTDESHHSISHSHEGEAGRSRESRGVPGAITVGPTLPRHPHLHEPEPPSAGISYSPNGDRLGQIGGFVEKQRPALVLGTMYALGHGSIVFVLGLLALLAREFLPDWIDPVMERVVGVTLLFLGIYLLYSVYRFFRGGEEFRLRSRWMLVFAGVRNAIEAVRSKVLGRPHTHVHAAQTYGVRTAYGIGVIHGIGAETGTQVLVITTAVGADSQVAGVLALVAFLIGLLISNSVVTVVTTIGFVSSRQRQGIYVAAGLVAAIFSLLVGSFFLLRSADALPDLDRYFGWLGGGS